MYGWEGGWVGEVGGVGEVMGWWGGEVVGWWGGGVVVFGVVERMWGIWEGRRRRMLQDWMGPRMRAQRMRKTRGWRGFYGKSIASAAVGVEAEGVEVVLPVPDQNGGEGQGQDEEGQVESAIAPQSPQLPIPQQGSQKS